MLNDDVVEVFEMITYNEKKIRIQKSKPHQERPKMVQHVDLQQLKLCILI
jgi:hypothetical protein